MAAETAGQIAAVVGRAASVRADVAGAAVSAVFSTVTGTMTLLHTGVVASYITEFTVKVSLSSKYPG
jgi:hypothetical protein